MKTKKIIVIGGGAAGFFAAFSAAEHHPEGEVILLEKTNKLLAKVKVSGGGRCNVTTGLYRLKDIAKQYPRGENFLKPLFREFGPRDIKQWFEQRGVPLYSQDDQRVFPTSNNSQTIIDCFMEEAKRCGISIKMQSLVKALRKQESQIEIELIGGQRLSADAVIIATGGSPKTTGLDWLKNLGHHIEPCVPSLFTFNLKPHPLKELMGLSVPNAEAKIVGTKLKESGPVLITHWGLSGPAILRLSAWGARVLAEKNYQFSVSINWLGDINEEKCRNQLKEFITNHPKRQIKNDMPFKLPTRIWHYLLEKAGVPENKINCELSKKDKNRLVNVLVQDVYEVGGKTTFKEEFVTCGGVSLESLNPQTMESLSVPNLFFTGEVLDIDGITGGFNFQAAWTTGYIAGRLGNNYI